ncbi:MAG TPA: helix-turn-helix domain-containing protein, partial [Candidatus Sumerlaeota bacterium]|nr:helix-turn-helix domain-containing protein [Candidatus Sumerlaeota bacterium]
AETLEFLRAQSWPGNVRELENILLRACALRPGLKRLEKSDLETPTSSRANDSSARLFSDGPLVIPEEGISFEDLERRILLAALNQSGHNQTRGAKLVGLPRQAFIYRLQKFGLLPGHGDSKPEGKA